MAVLTFKGGIHPHDGKNLSKKKPITEYKPKGDLVFPVSQHIGAPAKPIVNIGDKVLVGQLIAEANGFVSANIHSSVSGTVKAIEPRLVSSGAMVNSIVIENDEAYKTIETKSVKPLEECSKEEIRDLVKQAGVVGMGGAGFPTHVKLTPKSDEAIEYVIVNGAECEPYLTSDYRRMLETPELVIEGLKVVLALFKRAKGIIAIEDNKRDVIIKMKKLTQTEPRIEVKAVYTKYPQGSERHLIHAVTKRYINSNMLPADAGCIVDNVDTIVAIRRAVLENKPLISRIITLTGDAVKDPRNYEILVGSNMKNFIEDIDGFKKQPEKIIAGGPMMGIAMFDLDVPAVKGLSALLCIHEDEVSKQVTSACINCGRCVKVCPSGILPTKLAALSERGDTENFVKLDGMECCECGCCSYVCPAKINLAQSIKSMRKDVLASRRK